MKVPYGSGYLCMATHPKQPNYSYKTRGRTAHIWKEGELTQCKMKKVSFLSAYKYQIEDWEKEKKWVLPFNGVCVNCINLDKN